MSNEVRHLSKVIIEDGQTIMLFPQSLLEALNLQANEILEWEVSDDGFRVIRRKLIDPKNI